MNIHPWALAFTFFWIGILGGWGICLWRKPAASFNYAKYAKICAFVGVFLVIAAIIGVFFFLDRDWVINPQTKEMQHWIPPLVIFWSLAPPAWFFLEYFGVVTGKIVEMPPTVPPAVPLPEKIKSYADYSSKLWGAILAFYLLLLAHHFR